MDDKEIEDLYSRVTYGTRVEIFNSKTHEAFLYSSKVLNETILEGAKKQLTYPALYTHEASGVISLSYLLGDIPPDQAVCTDIVIRSLRHAGIDLQAMIHEDARFNSGRYTPLIKKPNYHIDHRRTRNLQRYLSVYATDLTAKPSAVKPGDIVIMDTGISNGTVYDHIGIVDDKKDHNGNYTVINIWTTGSKTESFSLLGHSYPEVVGIFRMTHLFDYL